MDEEKLANIPSNTTMEKEIMLMERRERLIKILLIELFIIFFIRFQIFDGIGIIKRKNEDEIPDKNQDEDVKNKFTLKHEYKNEHENTLDIFQLIEKGKEFMGSVKPYVNKREQYYIDIFTKLAEIVECHKQLVEYQSKGFDTLEEDNFDQIGFLKAVKPYMKEDKQEIIDKFIKLQEGIQILNEKMQKYDKEENNYNIVDRILDILEAIKPIIPDEKRDTADKIIKNIKLIDALNKAEVLMNSKNNTDKKLQENTNRGDDTKSKIALPSPNDRLLEKENQEPAKEEQNIKGDDGKDDIEKDDSLTSENNGTADENQSDEDAASNLNAGLTPQQSAVVDSLKSMLTKEQQQFMYNMINYLKQQSANNTLKNDEDANNGEYNAGN